jgi:hypothetical protein
VIHELNHGDGGIPNLLWVQLHQVLGDQIVKLSSHLHSRGAASHDHKRQQAFALLRGWGRKAGRGW